MPSYVITGVSRSLGWEFMNQISSDPKNTVIGLVRDKAATEKRVAEELSDRSNITILEADLTNYEALKKAAADSASITGGSLDYLIANAAYVPQWDAYEPIGDLALRTDEFDKEFNSLMHINVLANIHLSTLFLPQILKGQAKKVIVISSGMGDVDLVAKYDVDGAALYAMSKAAMNMITAKFSAQYKEQGVLFLSICPGMVDVGHFRPATPAHVEGAQKTMARFLKYAPHFKAPDTPQDSVKAVLSVIDNASIEKGNGGEFLSHFGNKQWL